jgi:hypothetical protein
MLQRLKYLKTSIIPVACICVCTRALDTQGAWLSARPRGGRSHSRIRAVVIGGIRKIKDKDLVRGFRARTAWRMAAVFCWCGEIYINTRCSGGQNRSLFSTELVTMLNYIPHKSPTPTLFLSFAPSSALFVAKCVRSVYMFWYSAELILVVLLFSLVAMSESFSSELLVEPSLKNVRVKVKFALDRPWWPRGGVELYLYSFFNLGARWGGWLAPCPGRFTPGKENRYPLYRRLGRPQGRSG